MMKEETIIKVALSAGAVEYTDCISAKNKYPQQASWIWH